MLFAPDSRSPTRRAPDRTKRFNMLVTEAELREINRLARKNGTSASDLIRFLLRYTRENPQVLR
jgi:Ribbon-helix-helix protein, copG family